MSDEAQQVFLKARELQCGELVNGIAIVASPVKVHGHVEVLGQRSQVNIDLVVHWGSGSSRRSLEDVEFNLFLHSHKGELLCKSPSVEDGMSQLIGVIFVVSNEEYLTILY